MARKPKIDLNPKFAEALRLMEDTREHLFVTGRAGTGKSTLLTHWLEQTAKNAVVLAPTGVAAINVGGETIHSFCGFRPDVTLQKVRRMKIRTEKARLVRQLDTIVIDEASMVRADLLDCVDEFLRRTSNRRSRPFGGIQMVFIGDLHQLPPIVERSQAEFFRAEYATPYFFSAHVFGGVQGQLMGVGERPELRVIELEKIYRQSDRQFIEALNAVRDGELKGRHLKLLNDRHDPDFAPDPRKREFWIHLTTTNAMADGINARSLARISGRPWRNEALLMGETQERNFPAPSVLELKPKSQVMFTSNDRDKRFVNGTVGRVVKIKERRGETASVCVELEGGEQVEVRPNTWESIRWTLDDREGTVESEVVGTYTQYPLRLAWAVTIHKAQGKTFDRAIVDFGYGTFAPGQAYVALSRCRSLEGLVLKRPMRQSHLMTDARIGEFMRTQDGHIAPGFLREPARRTH